MAGKYTLRAEQASLRTLRRLLALIAILAGITWAVLFGLAVQGWESEGSRQARTAAFVVMFVAGSLYPLKRHGSEEEEEETL
jgi:hypothetical protein